MHVTSFRDGLAKIEEAWSSESAMGLWLEVNNVLSPPFS